MTLNDADAVYVGGDAVDRVYAGTELVWEAIIPVTPEPPVFHDGEPWVTLPTVEGVTYTVQGTPGYSQQVTVTATAEEGYELVGQTSWTHTFGPPPRYGASGSTNSRRRINANTWTTMSSHTVTHAGIASGHFHLEWRFATGSGSFRIRVRRGNTTIATAERNESSSAWGYVQQLTIPTTTLAAGDTLTFQAYTTESSNSVGRDVDSWTWNLS